MVKLADTSDLGSDAARCAGSSPVIRTINCMDDHDEQPTGFTDIFSLDAVYKLIWVYSHHLLLNRIKGDIMIKTLIIIFLISTILSVLIVLGGHLIIDLTYEDEEIDK